MRDGSSLLVGVEAAIGMIRATEPSVRPFYVVFGAAGINAKSRIEVTIRPFHVG